LSYWLAVIATALAAWFAGSNCIAIILSLAILAWTVGWHESTNLWDYILDPFLGLWAIGSLIRVKYGGHALRVRKPDISFVRAESIDVRALYFRGIKKPATHRWFLL
jgi:hypothetical protein